MGFDEDCDPCTVSGGGLEGDADGDGFERTVCSNPWPTMSAPTGCNVRLIVDSMNRTVHGTDCNDVAAMMGAQQNPGLPEVCANMVDDNCNGATDGTVQQAGIRVAEFVGGSRKTDEFDAIST